MYYAVGTMIIVYDYNKVKKKENRTVYSQTSSLQSEKYCLQLDIEVIDKIPLHIPLD